MTGSAVGAQGAPVSFGRALKGWPGWAAIAAAALALLVIGGSRSTAPATADERVISIASRLSCPVCNGESAATSRSPASIEIRDRVRTLVDDGQLSDDDIVAAVDDAYLEDLRLTPDRSGLGVLAFALPVVAAVAAVGGLIAAMLRWRGARAGESGPSAEDRALVDAARHRSL